jgi:carboxyl-terminal processing protease
MSGDESVKPLGEMKVTVQKFYRITGKTTQLDGVTPDIVLPDFYNQLKNGESENEHPLASTTIEPVPFSQSAYRITDLKALRSNSEARVKDDPTFQKINENATRLRKMKDQTAYPLQLDKYRTWNQKQDEESKRYEDMFQPISGFVVENLAADIPQIQSDTSRLARNEDWMKDKRKDIQLAETLRIMYDMLRLDAIAAGKN